MRAGALLAVAALSIVATSAKAEITEIDLGFNIENHQTGAGAVSPTGAFFSADVLTRDPVTTASLAFPGPTSPQALALIQPDHFGFQTGLLADQAALTTAYPAGDYTFTVGSGPSTQSFGATVGSTIFSTEVPEIANYDAFTTLDPTKDFTVNLTGGFTAQGDESFTFFTIFDTTTNMEVYDQGFLPSTTTSFLIDANTLTAGHSYSFETIFDNRFTHFTLDAATSFQLFDNRTSGEFTLAGSVPEPATWGLMIVGFGIVGASARRRHRLRVA